jgi:hypothetical protein
VVEEEFVVVSVRELGRYPTRKKADAAAQAAKEPNDIVILRLPEQEVSQVPVVKRQPGPKPIKKKKAVRRGR